MHPMSDSLFLLSAYLQGAWGDRKHLGLGGRSDVAEMYRFQCKVYGERA